MPGVRRWRPRRALSTVAAGLAAAALVAPRGVAHGDTADGDRTELVLVTFDGPGTAGYDGPLDRSAYRDALEQRQHAALEEVGAPDPRYRWTTALSGFAVELTPEQVSELRALPQVATVEENTVRRLATTGPTAAPAATPPGAGRGGAGVVIGVVDTGIWPESPLFTDSPAQTTRPKRFARSCDQAEDWPAATCNDKLVAAHWFVEGFGAERVAADEPLSARDVRGHGTQVASIAAGNAEVPVRTPGLRDRFSGVAPGAGLAVYKACWSAPDPTDDGCATADLVTAVDRATAERVDVLNLSVAGAPGIDTVERALLGAAEAGIVVVAAAGNHRAEGYATHVSPWVTTVGALTGPTHTGAVVLGKGRRLSGVMTSRRDVRARVVRGADIAAPGWSRRDAAACTPGSLDASRAAGRIVVCARGEIPRIAKSAAVDRANGVGMVLLNGGPGAPTHDLHAVPTVHLSRSTAEKLTRWLRREPRARLGLVHTGAQERRMRVTRRSAAGDPRGSVVKPDLVAPGTGLLGSVPPTVTPSRWAFLSGTSAAAAWVSGTAATLVGRQGWSAPVVRSALAASSARVPGSVLRTGAGVPHTDAAQRTRLVHAVRPGDYRAWLSGDLDELNSTSLLFRGDGTAARRLTNVGGRRETWTASVEGFERYDVSVSPPSVTVGPRRSASYRVRVTGGSVAGGLDEGSIVWRAADGSSIRVPVAITR